MKKITLFVMDADEASEKPSDAQWVHLWDVVASDAAIAEVPTDYLCDSEWSNPELFKK